jgi:hypothetical protein
MTSITDTYKPKLKIEIQKSDIGSNLKAILLSSIISLIPKKQSRIGKQYGQMLICTTPFQKGKKWKNLRTLIPRCLKSVPGRSIS